MNLSAEPLILVINPGSTSTKVALFRGRHKLTEETLRHTRDQLARFSGLWDQFDFRLSAVQAFLSRQNLPAFSLQAVVGRGGLLKPVSRGTYEVNPAMIADARQGVQGEHVANLGCAIALEISKLYGGRPLVVDPVSVDEFDPLARYSGHPLLPRRSLAHTLNLRAASLWAAEKLELDPQTCNFVVAHLGGGFSIAPIRRGRIIDVNDASSGGPFSPDRTGSLPLQPFIDLVFSGSYDKAAVKKMVMGEGGLAAYLGTTDAVEIEERIQRGDAKAKEVYQAMAYQIAKEIGAMATVLCGDVAAVVLTGGLVHSSFLIQEISRRVRFIAQVILLPGELEMEAMAEGAWRVLTGQEQALSY